MIGTMRQLDQITSDRRPVGVPSTDLIHFLQLKVALLDHPARLHCFLRNAPSTLTVTLEK